METNNLKSQPNLPRKSAPATAGILAFMGSYLVLTTLLQLLAIYGFGMPMLGGAMVGREAVMSAISLVAILFSAWWVLRFLDHRPFADLGLSLKGRGGDVAWGLCVAGAIYATSFAVLLLCGAVTVEKVQFDWRALGGSFFFFILVALSEEIMIRGYVLGRLLRTRLNKFVSLGISSAIFALLHIFNPNVEFLPMLNLVLAGFLLGASYLYTRNLWFPISLHLFWNWIQGALLGFKVSGHGIDASLLTIRLPESNLLNGGEFGFEGSILCTVLIGVATLLIILYFERRRPL